MKRLIGLSIAAMCMAIPAHSQGAHVGMAGSANTGYSGGGGGFGGGTGFGGGATGSKLPSVPPARFNMVSASGSDSYIPSTFLAFDKALVAAQTILETPAPTVADAARQQMSVHSEKAKIAFVQDDYGRATIVRR